MGSYPDKVATWSSISEVFWKCADLTGKDLIIAHPERGQMAELGDKSGLRAASPHG